MISQLEDMKRPMGPSNSSITVNFIVKKVLVRFVMLKSTGKKDFLRIFSQLDQLTITIKQTVKFFGRTLDAQFEIQILNGF